MTRPPWAVRVDSFPRLASDLRHLHPSLELCFNFLRARYEVWGDRGLVLRIEDVNDDFAPPGPWVLEVVRGARADRPRPDAFRDPGGMEREALRGEELDKRARDAVQNRAPVREEVRTHGS